LNWLVGIVAGLAIFVVIAVASERLTPLVAIGLLLLVFTLFEWIL